MSVLIPANITPRGVGIELEEKSNTFRPFATCCGGGFMSTGRSGPDNGRGELGQEFACLCGDTTIMAEAPQRKNFCGIGDHTTAYIEHWTGLTGIEVDIQW